MYTMVVLGVTLLLNLLLYIEVVIKLVGTLVDIKIVKYQVRCLPKNGIEHTLMVGKNRGIYLLVAPTKMLE